MSMEIVQDKIEDHEHRIVQLEISAGRMDERLQELVRATDNLKKSTYGFSLIMLLTIVYLLLGRQGYKDITGTFIPIQQQVEQTTK